MSELISGKEALIALANGEEIECCVTKRDSGLNEYWFSAKTLTVDEIEGEETEGDSEGVGIYKIRFRLKPRTITINGIEVPAPFEPKDDELYYYIDSDLDCGFNTKIYDSESDSHKDWMQFGAWRTEDEIKKIVEMKRQIFK